MVVHEELDGGSDVFEDLEDRLAGREPLATSEGEKVADQPVGASR